MQALATALTGEPTPRAEEAALRDGAAYIGDVSVAENIDRPSVATAHRLVPDASKTPYPR